MPIVDGNRAQLQQGIRVLQTIQNPPVIEQTDARLLKLVHILQGHTRCWNVMCSYPPSVLGVQRAAIDLHLLTSSPDATIQQERQKQRMHVDVISYIDFNEIQVILCNSSTSSAIHSNVASANHCQMAEDISTLYSSR